MSNDDGGGRYDNDEVVHRADYDCCSLTELSAVTPPKWLVLAYNCNSRESDKSERGRADRDIQRLRAKEFSPSKAASSGTGDGALEYGNFV